MQITTNKSILLLLLIVSTLLLIIGLVAPIITFNKFIFIENTFSILTACWNLLKEGQLFLFVVITLFSIVMPIFKISILAKLILSKSLVSINVKRAINLIHHSGKWSMLDVFVVAILVVVVKLGAIGNVEKHIGLYAYAGAAILIMLLTNLVINHLKQQEV